MTGQAKNDWGQTEAQASLDGMSSYRINPSRITMANIIRRESLLTLAALASAEGQGTGQTVLIKKFDLNREDVNEFGKSFKAFVKEVKLMKELSHPNVIRLSGFVEDMANGDAWIVVPWEGYGNVREFVRSAKPNVPERVSLIQDTINGLAYLHTRQPPIYHGSLKSPNIFVNTSKRAIITEFQASGTQRDASTADVSPSGLLLSRRRKRHLRSGNRKTADKEHGRAFPTWEASLHAIFLFFRRIRRFLTCGYNTVQESNSLTAKFDPSTFGIAVVGSESSLQLEAPEVLQDGLRDLPSDVWDIGWICYEITTSRIPFEEHGPRMPTAMYAVVETLGAIREDAQFPHAVELCNLMSDCWGFQPAERIDAATLWQKVHLISATISEETSAGAETLPANSPLELGAVSHLQEDTAIASAPTQSVTHVTTRMKEDSVRAGGSNDLHESHPTFSEQPYVVGGARSHPGHQEVMEALREALEILSGSTNDLDGANATGEHDGSPQPPNADGINGQNVTQTLSRVDNDPQSPRSPLTQVENCTGSLITKISDSPFDSTGGSCDVFEAIHQTVGRVALKCPRIQGSAAIQDIIRRFEREADTWKHLKHPYVLEFLGTFERDGLFYIVSPFIIHGTIGKYIAHFPSINRVKLLRQAADALHYLHSKGVVHGDVKGNNILVSDSGSALLCDFSLTKVLPAVTSTLMKGAGSVRWMAPELWDNAAKSFDTDVYAFGMTIAEVLTGAKPLSHISNDVTFILAVASEDVRPAMAPMFSPSGASYSVAWGIAAECWPKDPSRRISISEVFRRFSEADTRRGSDMDIPQAVEGLDTISGVQLAYQAAKQALKKVYKANCRITGSSAMSGMNMLNGLDKVSAMDPSDEEAEKAFITAKEIHSRIGSEMGSADALDGLGRTYLGQLKYEEAGRAFREALEIYSRIESDIGIANASDGLGRTYLTQRRYEEARGVFLEAFEIHSRIGNDVGTADALDGLGCTYLAQLRYEEAGRAFREASTIYSRIDDDTGIANASDGLGRTYLAQLKYEEAEEALKEAHEISYEIGNDIGVANALDGLGHIYLAQSKHEEGLKVFGEARDVYSQIGSHIGVGNVSRSLGGLYNQLGRYEEAITSLTEALDAYGADDASKSRAMGLLDLARVYYTQGRYPEAEDSVNEALAIWSSTSDSKGQAGALLLLERILSSQFKYEEAAEILIQAEAMFSEAGNEACHAAIFSSLGCMYLTQANYADAEQWLDKARAAYTRIEDKEGETRVLESLIELYAMQDSLAQAKSICIDAHRIYAQMSVPMSKICAKTWEFIDMWDHYLHFIIIGNRPHIITPSSNRL